MDVSGAGKHGGLRVLLRKAGLASGVKMRMTGGNDYSGAWI